MFPILNPSPSSHPIPSLWVIPVHQSQASCIICIKPGLAIRFTYDIIYVSVPLPQIVPPSPTESKRLFYTSVSLLLSRIEGCRYHLSKFHIHLIFKTWFPFSFGGFVFITYLSCTHTKLITNVKCLKITLET